MIYTVGYTAINMEELEAVMADKAIGLLVDVRSAPYNRRTYPEFNRNRLEQRFGRRYTWKGNFLGGKFGPASEEGLDWLVLQGNARMLLLLCMEADPLMCHRFYDIGIRLLERGIDMVHLVRTNRKAGGPLIEMTTSQLKGARNGIWQGTN